MTLRVAQFFLKIAHLSFSMGPRGPCAYGLRPRLWLLFKCDLAFLGWHQLFLKSSCKFNWTFQSTVIPKVFLFFSNKSAHFPRYEILLIQCIKLIITDWYRKTCQKKNLSSIQITIYRLLFTTESRSNSSTTTLGGLLATFSTLS